jgi:hypothetical protein
MRTHRTTPNTRATAVIDYDKDLLLLLSERAHHTFTAEKLLTMINRRVFPTRVSTSLLGYLTTRVGVICCRVTRSAVDMLSQLSMQSDDHQVTFPLHRHFFQGAQLPMQSGEMLSNGVAERYARPLSFDWRMP